MNIHEYQAKSLLRKYGVAVPDGGAAYTVDEAVTAAKELPGPVWVVKSQIHAGGRGAGHFKDAADDTGGVRLAKSVDEVKQHANAMLGKVLVTKQTGPAGKEVKRIYIEDGCDIARELYLSILIDRVTSRITIMASTEGGMDIEEVAAKTPEKIIMVAIDPAVGMLPFYARKIAFGLELEGKQVSSAVKLLTALYQAFTDLDASLLEINPLVVTGDGEVIALDAKMNFDDNGLYRHPDVVEMRDLNEEEPLEVKASEYDLNYIKLDGNVGCMVNGAGLAMGTMDIVQLYGGSPANFLDVGGATTRERVTEAFKIILSDANVATVLINIFGGIVRCDLIAEGVIGAVEEVGVEVPVVVRLEGNNAKLGREVLQNSGFNIIAATSLSDAAEKAVAAAGGAQ